MHAVQEEEQNSQLKLTKLNQKKQFSDVYKLGKFKKSDYFTIRYLHHNSGVIRYAITARKKILKRAVDRNYAKRRLAHLFRDFPPNHSGDFVIQATALTITANFEDIKNDFIKIVHKSL